MNKLKIMLCTVVAIFGFTTVSNAFSLNGVYLEAGSSAVGVELDGSHNDTTGLVSTGQLGKTAVTGSFGLGYMTSRDNRFGMDFGYMWSPGEAKLTTTSTHDNAQSPTVTFEVSDATEFYIAPMINITEDASLFFKFGKNDADTKVTGDVTKPSDLSGTTVALGTVMSWGSNLFIRTEAGMTDYDKITVTGKGTGCGLNNSGCVATTTSVSADPTVHYGKIAIGYKF